MQGCLVASRWDELEQKLRRLGMRQSISAGDRRTYLDPLPAGCDHAAQHRALLQNWVVSKAFSCLASYLRPGGGSASGAAWYLKQLRGVGTYNGKDMCSWLLHLGPVSCWDRGPIGPGSEVCAWYLLGENVELRKASGVWPDESSARAVQLQRVLLFVEKEMSRRLGVVLAAMDGQHCMCYHTKFRSGRISFDGDVAG